MKIQRFLLSSEKKMSLEVFVSADKKLQKIFLTLDSGSNVLLHGPGGVGKTHSLRLIARYLTEKGKIVACTATTGVAAINLNIPEKKIMARTLHSWAGVGLARDSVKKLYEKIMTKNKYRNRWRTVQVLIIDEISMLGQEFFEKLDYLGKHIRMEQDAPFGGIQMVLSGDFLQLPPVKDKWVFKSETWNNLSLIPFIFEEPKRYDDIRYFELLLRIRKGEHTDEDIELLEKRAIAYRKLQNVFKKFKYDKTLIRPTILYSTKADVKFYNEKELKKLSGKMYEFVAEDIFQPYREGARSDSYIHLLDEMIPRVITVKVGAQVMLKANLNVSEGLVNGTRGVITDIITTSPEPIISVKFLNGRKLDLTRHVWKLEDKEALVSRSQFPLILAYSITVHKGQGATLDYAICDLGPSIFAEGQAYVALSRVRNLYGLFISEFHKGALMTNKTALKFDQKLLEKEKNFSVQTEVVFLEDECLGESEGQIRVGKIIYKGGNACLPSFPDFTPVVVLAKSSKYSNLSPCTLKDESGYILENIWQFSKVYRSVPKTKQAYSHFHPNWIIWEHPEETLTDQFGEPLPSYWKWRERGFKNLHPVRATQKNCLYFLKEKGGKRLSCIEARKQIYFPTYCRLVKKEAQFSELKTRLLYGENLLIIEVNGPHQESLKYYREVYGVSENFIDEDTILANLENLRLMLNDPKHPFGYGYCLAAALLGLENKLLG